MQARRPPPGRTRTLALPLAWCLAPPCGLHSYSGRCPQPADGRDPLLLATSVQDVRVALQAGRGTWGPMLSSLFREKHAHLAPALPGAAETLIPAIGALPRLHTVPTINTGSPCFILAANRQLQCRDAAKIDHNQRPRLNKSNVLATVFNVGCISGARSARRTAR